MHKPTNTTVLLVTWPLVLTLVKKQPLYPFAPHNEKKDNYFTNNVCDKRKIAPSAAKTAHVVITRKIFYICVYEGRHFFKLWGLSLMG